MAVTKEQPERLSVPGAGQVLSTVTEERACHVRAAVEALRRGLHKDRAEEAFLTLFAPRWNQDRLASSDEEIGLRACWAMANVWLLAMAAQKAVLSLPEAEAWFLGNHGRNQPSLVKAVSADAQEVAVNELSHLMTDKHLLDLLPYILEPHGPGSRLSVMRDPGTRHAREAKKRSGVFYTPSDVAEYMVEAVLRQHGSPCGELRCLDPCCGTGVYLAALIRTAMQSGLQPLDYAARCLYGIDRSPLAVDSCAFVLLHYCIPELTYSPWSAWHLLRLNLSVADAIPVGRARAGEQPAGGNSDQRDSVRRQLQKGRVPPSAEGRRSRTPRQAPSEDDGYNTLGSIFPEARGGFDILVTNPPYSDIGRRDDRAAIEREFCSVGAGLYSAAANSYLLFTEMMWRLTRPGRNVSSLVVPLSIAYHQGKQYQACRQAMAANGGRWQFAFFDREPHALFGEDVKTRNAILIRRESAHAPPRGEPAEIETGPMRKWTSRTRSRLFREISFTPIVRADITRGIAKLSGRDQAEAYAILSARTQVLKGFWQWTRSCLPVEATKKSECPRVFLAGTAYNFLNVFRSFELLPGEDRNPLSENPVHCLECLGEAAAEVVFAILSSRLAFWLWHVRGDGFHVGSGLAETLPFDRSSFTGKQLRKLRDCGRRLWTKLQKHRIVSLNKGRATVAFRPLACEEERDAIDAVLVEAAGLPMGFAQTLKEFVKGVVLVDENDCRRSHLKDFFADSETTAVVSRKGTSFPRKPRRRGGRSR